MKQKNRHTVKGIAGRRYRPIIQKEKKLTLLSSIGTLELYLQYFPLFGAGKKYTYKTA